MEELVSSGSSELFCENVFQSCGKAISVSSSSGRKTAAKDIGMKAIDVGRTVAIAAGKQLVENAAKSLTTPKPQVANVIVPPEEILQK